MGKHAARFLSEKGAVIVAASDSGGTIADENGLDLPALVALKSQGRSVHDCARGRKLSVDAVIDIPCEIWIPAARPDVIHAMWCGCRRALWRRVQISPARRRPSRNLPRETC